MASQSISFRPTAVIRQIPWSLDQRAAFGLLLILITFSLVGWLYSSTFKPVIWALATLRVMCSSPATTVLLYFYGAPFYYFLDIF